jgi:hypothetical protein
LKRSITKQISRLSSAHSHARHFADLHQSQIAIQKSKMGFLPRVILLFLATGSRHKSTHHMKSFSVFSTFSTIRITLALVVAAALTLLLPAVSSQAADVKPLRALMVTGGCCHDYPNQKNILSEGISKRANVTWTIVHEGGDTRNHKISIYNNPEWWKGYDIVLHNECFGYVDDVPFVEGIAAAHKQAGVPAVMLHCSSHSYRMAQTEAWRECIGITSTNHEKLRPLTIKVLKGDHPVMKGFPAVWENPGDELYKNVKLWPNCIPLAQSYGEDTKKDHVVIWLNTVGKARVFSTTLGHANVVMQDPLYLDLVTRGVLWACDKLDDKGEPKKGYGPASK